MDPILEAAREADYAKRLGLASHALDVILPLAGLASTPEERGLALTTKSYESFVVDGKTMSVKSIVSDEREPDRAREIVVLDGLDYSDFKNIPIGCLEHQRRMPISLYQDPKSKACTLLKTGKQLRGEEFFVQNGPFAPLALQVFQLHECGLLRGKSIGFTSRWDDWKRIPDDPNQPYGPAATRIEKSKLIEISSVFVPENAKALVTEVIRKGLSGGGSGPVPLLAPIMNLLAPWADPAEAWANGWTPATDGTPTDGSGGKDALKTPSSDKTDKTAKNYNCGPGMTEEDKSRVPTAPAYSVGGGNNSKPMASQTENWTCPSCGGSSRPWSKKCEHCRIGINPKPREKTADDVDDPPANSGQGAKTMTAKKCNCGSEYAEYRGHDGQCPECRVTDLSKSLNELQTEYAGDRGKSLKQRAAEADWYDKAITKSIGLPIEGVGRPGPDRLKAAYHASMYTAAAALIEMEAIEGPCQKSLREFAIAQADLGARIVHAFKTLYPDQPDDWVTQSVSPAELADPNRPEDERMEKTVKAAAEWALRAKGWSRGHTVVCRDAHQAIEAIVEKGPNYVLTDADRDALRLHAKSLAGMIGENGKLVSVTDREVDAKVKSLAEKLDAAEKKIAQQGKIIANARAGLPMHVGL